MEQSLRSTTLEYHGQFPRLKATWEELMAFLTFACLSHIKEYVTLRYLYQYIGQVSGRD